MNLYGVLAMIMLLLVLGFMYDLAPVIKLFADRLVANVPALNSSRSSNPAIYDLGVLMIWLITIVAVLKLFLQRRKGDDG